MSDSSDRSQRLRDDESRSSDGSRAAGSITNYFAPDEDEEVPVETLINSVPDILAIDIVPPAGRYDSIFNTSGEGMRGPGLGDRRRPEGEIVNARVGRDSRVANSSIWHNDARGPVGSGCETRDYGRGRPEPLGFEPGDNGDCGNCARTRQKSTTAGWSGNQS